MKQYRLFLTIACFFIASLAHSTDNTLTQSLWANQVISSVYHYDYNTYMADQKKIARYFSAAAWIEFTKANAKVKLPQLIKEHQWSVRSVPIAPPVLKPLPEGHWQADMPILVQYKNNQQAQYQTMQVQLQFSAAKQSSAGNKWRVDSFKATVLQSPCKCALTQAKNNIKSLGSL